MKPGMFTRTVALSLAGAIQLALAVPAIAAPPTPVPSKIADQHAIDLRLDGRMVSARAQDARPMEIRTPDAAFIKVHFDHFSLPDGVVLEVANPDGSEIYRYSKRSRDGFTVAAELGQNGRTSFSAMLIQGPVVVMRLVGTAREPWRAEHGVRISKYLEGFPEAMLPQLQSEGLLDRSAQPLAICGNNDKQAAACYASSDPVAYDRTRPVARLVMSSGGMCTGWRVSADNRMFTNNHCISSAAGVAGTEIWFNYQLASCGGSAAPPTKVSGSTLLQTDRTLDYTLFTVNNFANIGSFGYLGLDINAPVLNQEIFIAGHPGGRQKELSVVSDQDGGGRCKINNPSTDGMGSNTDAGYYCDTEGGSSGSPVLARASNRALALHHLGGCLNKGAKISLIWPQVSSHFGGVVPAGDNEGGNTAPVANFTASPNGLTVAFIDTSSDNDGTIASRSWSFGDGTTSTAANPNKTYAAAGTYTVTLTVTDDDGATSTKTAAVTVSAVNSAPVANFTATPNGLTVAFTDTSSDSDGTIASRSWNFGDGTTSTATSPSKTYAAAGSYSVSLTVMDDDGASSTKTSSVTVSSGGGSMSTYINNNDVLIRDNATVESLITVSGRSGNAPTNATVTVAIVHTAIGDLKVDLVAPDGTLYNLHNRTDGSTDNLNKAVVLDLSAHPLAGTWRLRVNDAVAPDVGKIDSWRLRF